LVEGKLGAAKQTITKALIEQLRDEILAGEIEPGTRLRQQEVATRFNVSTTPVREAFSALEREGLVSGAAHRGVVVFRPTAGYMASVYEIRLALETLAIGKAAERISDEQLEALGAVFAEMDAVFEAGDRDAYHVLNFQFHDLINAAAGNAELADLVRQLRESVNAYIRLSGRQATRADGVHLDHRELLQALREHDGAKAAAVMARHLDRVLQFSTSSLFNEGQAGSDSA
jgi:DNA-binding GntR family transcriptional regulator